MTMEEFANKLVTLFPDKVNAHSQHYQEYGELLGHVFFADEINIPIMQLLRENKDIPTITKYCIFIEEMWQMVLRTCEMLLMSLYWKGYQTRKMSGIDSVHISPMDSNSISMLSFFMKI